jgi:hypothetical protein
MRIGLRLPRNRRLSSLILLASFWQAERSHTNQINGGWGNEFRPAKPGWVEEKPRVNENRWDKPGGGPFVERAKPFGAVDDHHHVGGPPGGPPMGGKWREDGDRVLPRREPVPRSALCHSAAMHGRCLSGMSRCFSR